MLPRLAVGVVAQLAVEALAVVVGEEQPTKNQATSKHPVANLGTPRNSLRGWITAKLRRVQRLEIQTVTPRAGGDPGSPDNRSHARCC